MPVFKWLLGGFAGGAIGAVVWILVVYFLNIEVGYIAIGIGVLSGLGVRMASRYDDTPPTTAQSVIAAAIALLMVVGAKFVVVSLMMDDALAEQRMQFNESLSPIVIEEDELPFRLAQDEIQRREEAGEPVNWPEGMSSDLVETEDDIPAEVMTWANAKYKSMSPDERAAEVAQQQKALNDFIEALKTTDMFEPGELWAMKFEAFTDSFSPFDLLWIGLAVVSAYQIGQDDESNTAPA